MMTPPCVLFEDEHLLVVNKPAGINTHSPGPFSGEGLYEWLRHRESRWARLAILQRLDKETSGVMVFGKTTLANRSLTEQFTKRDVRKRYVLLTDGRVRRGEFVAKSKLARFGERYASSPAGETAETRFKPAAAGMTEPAGQPRSAAGPHAPGGSGLAPAGCAWVEAEPLTGRTHQIRVHAAEHGFPILGDTLYGGTPFDRVCLHAAELTLRHPATGESMTFGAPPEFDADARAALRAALIPAAETSAFRIIHGASDRWPGLYVDRLGDFLLSQSERDLTDAQAALLRGLTTRDGEACRGVYHKILSRKIGGRAAGELSPRIVFGEPAPERFRVIENGLAYELGFREGYSVGLFPDQRDNRRRLITNHVAAGFDLPQPVPGGGRPDMLNAFAYTCAFSVCAAKGGARTTSLDLSRKYLEWGRRHFTLNGLDPADHDFIFGDVFDWLRRLARKARAFDIIVLDPPTFSRSKEHGVFRVEKDYPRLIRTALPLLRPGGVLLASANAAGWAPEEFVEGVEAAVRGAPREILQRHYAPQPPDFPVSRAEPAHLKTVWLRLG